MGKYLQGYPSLMNKLQKLKTSTEPAVKIAMEQAAELIVAMMRSLVQVQHGDLKESIGWTWGSAPKGSISFTAIKGRLILTIYAGNEVAYYARWVEFGTAPHDTGGIFKGGYHPGTSPQPFFYPAFRALKKKASSMMAKSIRDEVKKAIA
jgi:HK97 gp10 family phage protein